MTARRARLAAVVVLLGVSAWGCGSSSPSGGATGGAGAGAGGGAGSGGAGTGPGGGAGTGLATGGAGSGGQAGTSGAAGTVGQPDGGGSTPGDAGGGAADVVGAPDGATEAGAPGTAALTQFLRIIQVTTVQGTQTVSISIDGTKNHTGTIHAGQALMMRIHVRPDTGWVAHPTVAELHLVDTNLDVILTSAPRTITTASSAQNLESTFNFDLTAAQVTKTLKFNVALRDPAGTPETPPPAIQRALYPRTGALDTLDAQ